MNWQQIRERLQELFTAELFTVSGTEITVPTILSALLILVAGFLLSRFLRAALVRTVQRKGMEATGRWESVGRLIHYTVMVLTFAMAADTLGFKISTLFAAGAVFAVGIGFAMQNIAQNFVSGVILMAEGAIKPGDILEVDGQIVKVIDMGIRSTIARTMFDEELIIPNSALVQGTVKNFTLNDTLQRIRVPVGVHYDSDMTRVREVLTKTAASFEDRRNDPPPRIMLTDFGASSVDWEISIWTDDPWRSRSIASELRQAVWFALQQAEIVIPYPQVDVHFDPPVTEAVAARSADA